MEVLKKTRFIIWIIVTAMGLSWGEALARNGQFPTNWGWHPMWGFGGMFMTILMFLFAVAVIAGILLLIRWMFTGKPISLDRGETALDILKKRYARGEIDREEFEEKKKLLE